MPRKGRHELIINDKLIAMGKKVSPIGKTAAQAAELRAKKSAAYRKEQAARAPFQEIAWLLIKYRMDRGLTQHELAERVGTSHTQISRIESGRHKPNVETLLRIAHALNLKMLLGFEASSKAGPSNRELITL